MQLTLDKRPCHISNAMSTNTEKHGDEDVGAIDLPVDGIVLKKADLEALLGAGAFEALYLTDTDLPEVRFTALNYPLSLKAEFTDARVELWLGIHGDKPDDPGLVLGECKVRALKVTPTAGGMTLCKLSVRATPDADVVATLYDCLNTDGSVSIADAKHKPHPKDKQKDLALPPGEDEPPTE